MADARAEAVATPVEQRVAQLEDQVRDLQTRVEIMERFLVDRMG